MSSTNSPIRYEQVARDLPDHELDKPTHVRSCCPYIATLHEEYSVLLFVEIPRVLFGIVLLIMFFWEGITPVTSTYYWFCILITYFIWTVGIFVAASSLSGVWFQRGKSVADIWGPYLQFVLIQLLGGGWAALAAGHIRWKLCNASPVDIDTTFAACGLTTPLVTRSYSEWDNAISIFVSIQIISLGQLLCIYMNAVRGKRGNLG